MRAVRLPVPPESARAWHARARAAGRLTLPWDAGVEASALAASAFMPDAGATRLVEPLAAGDPRRADRALAWRHALARADLAWAAQHPAPRTVLVSGATGFVGRALTAALSAFGHEVWTLSRGAAGGPRAVRWDPMRGVLDLPPIPHLHAVVHLAGAGIADRRWTAERRREIRDSRVRGTTLLAERLASLARPPAVLVSASAMGLYGDRGDQLLDEDASAGEGFLPGVAVEWEAATRAAADAGIRVVLSRTSLVLDPRGGALGRLRTLFRLGLGGPLAGGRAWWSWITLDDLVAVLVRAIDDPRLAGPVNVATPHPVTNAEFTRTLARVVARPAVLPVPRFALRAALGGFADEGLLASARLVPARLAAAGHAFRHERLEPALRAVLGLASHAESVDDA